MLNIAEEKKKINAATLKQILWCETYIHFIKLTSDQHASYIVAGGATEITLQLWEWINVGAGWSNRR